MFMERKWHEKTWIIVLLIIFFWPIGLFLFLKNKYYSKASRLLVGLILLIFLGVVVSSGNKSADNKPQEIATNQETSEELRLREEQVKREREEKEAAEKSRKEKEAAELKARKEREATERKDKIVDIIASVENFENLRNNYRMSQGQKQMEILQAEADFANQMLEVINAYYDSTIPHNVYDLYAENQYGNFEMIPLKDEYANSIRGNVLRENVSYDDVSKGKYKYEIINGFWDGNPLYPVLNYSHKFDRNRNEKSDSITILDINSIACSHGTIYINTVTLTRQRESFVEDNQTKDNLVELCHPTLYRFQFTGKTGDSSSNVPAILKDTEINSFKTHFDFGSKASNNHIAKKDVNSWYDPSAKNPDDLGKAELYHFFLFDDVFLNECRDILIFAIYKLQADM